MPRKKIRFHPTPPQVITLSFAAMILVGALLLNLPFASQSGESVGFLNALFTATSANCVTGLVVVNTLRQWTVFGKIVILALIQFGALGFITVVSLGMLLLHRRIPLRGRTVISASFNQDSAGGMARLVKNVVAITLCIETAGALLLAPAFYLAGGMTPWQALYNGAFHSVSAFCNAGFDNIGTSGLVPYRSNWAVNLIIMALIVAGGLGFTVWGELICMARNPQKRSFRTRAAHLSLHRKIALTVTGALIAAGLVVFLLLEWGNPETLGGLPPAQKALGALFQSVTLRTAGFNTLNQAGLSGLSKVASGVLMIIGGSPAGTAGGIKTVTLGVVFIAVLSALRGKPRMEAFGRTLPLELLQKALTVICTLLTVVVLATLALHFSERGSVFNHNALDLFFETASAVGTVGVSTGITPYLSQAGKAIVILCMFLGRLSPVTVVVALHLKMRAAGDSIAYPDERVIIG
jgi:trk system potassium uptake protein TrkH